MAAGVTPARAARWAARRGAARWGAVLAGAALLGLAWPWPPSWPPPAAALPACRISEFPCKTNKCIRLDRYCDGRDDCGDKSDEPPHCTVCNRTYYGDVGKTYELSLGKPPLDRIPYNCHLTFTASGHTHGELIQLIFDEFHVGRYLRHAADAGCPDGHMTLAELGRPFTGGFWCGASSGYAVYFSEVSTVTLSLRLFASTAHAATPFRFHLRYRFITRDDAVVRFGSHDKQVERGTGVPGTYCSRQFDECYRKKCKLQSPNYPGMYPRNVTCFLSLRQKEVPHCKHAMITVHQNAEHKIQIKRAAAALPASVNKTSRAVRVWDDCSGPLGERDYLVFYDGPSTSDPVLIKWCGGDWLPKISSRGPEMLVAFHSSAFSAPLHALSPLRGFELEVDVMFSDSDSLDYQRDPRKCEFWINATSWGVGGAGNPPPRWGHVLSPRHTLPPNTTCTYRFHGLAGDTVWLYFLAYSHHSLLSTSSSLPSVLATPATSTTTTSARPPSLLHNHLLLLPPRPASTPPPSPWIGLSGTKSNQAGSGSHHRSDLNHILGVDPAATPSTASACSMRLRIWDGGGTTGLPVLASHCDKDGPRLCAHAALGNATRTTRSCGPHESYESTGTDLTMQHTITEGTALHPVHWRLHYEFVDTNLGGEAWTGRGAILASGAVASAGRPLSRPPIPCARLFRKLRSGDVFSPRNVFMFGRGGAANLSCIYRIEAASNERIRLTVDKASFGGDSDACSTVADPHTGRPSCAYAVGARTSELRLWEVPWRDVRLPRACLCDNTTVTSRPFVYQSASRVLELAFTVTQLNVTEDFDDLHFHATFEMVRSNECSRKQRLRGAGGEIEFESPASSRTDLSCEGLPWMVEAHENKSLFLLTWGSFLPVSGPIDDSTTGSSPSRCHTRSRILLYSGRPLRLARVVCPLPQRERPFSLHVFSEEWFGLPAGQQLPAAPPGTQSYTAVAVAAMAAGATQGFGGYGAPSFLVEWVGRDSASAALHWLEISRPKLALQQRLWSEKGAKPPPDAIPKGNLSLALGWDCPHKCPELNACISESLWCDGRPNCPSGFDEADPKCEFIGRRIFTWLPGGLYFAMASAGAGCVALLLACLLLVLCRARARRRRLQAKQDAGYGGYGGYGGGSGAGTLSSVTSSRGTIGSRGSLSAGLSGGSLPGTYRRTKSRRRSDGTGRRLSGVDGDAIANQPRRVPTSELLLDANS